MTLDLQFKLKSNPLYIKFLRENSGWYKILNRNPEAFSTFVEEMREKYQLRPEDRFNRMMDNISMVQTFLEVLK